MIRYTAPHSPPGFSISWREIIGVEVALLLRVTFDDEGVRLTD